MYECSVRIAIVYQSEIALLFNVCGNYFPGTFAGFIEMLYFVIFVELFSWIDDLHENSLPYGKQCECFIRVFQYTLYEFSPNYNMPVYYANYHAGIHILCRPI